MGPQDVVLRLYLSRGLVNDSEGLSQTVRVYRKAVNLYSKCAEAWMGMGQGQLFQSACWEEAEQAYRSVLFIKPNSLEAWSFYAVFVHA